MIASPEVKSDASDSDSDWDDDDDDYGNKKINIKIRPIAQVTPGKISASVDELRATVGTWKSLANINLVKPNSRRSHHQSTVQLNPTPITIPISVPTQDIRTSVNQNQLPLNKLPVAFAIQECLNAQLLKSQDGGKCSSANLIGRLKMAAPPEIITTNLLQSLSSSSSTSSLASTTNQEHNLQVTLVTSIPWDHIRLNSKFVCELEQEHEIKAQPFLFSNSVKKLLIDMQAVRSYVQRQYQIQPNTKYFILPELLRYTIGSQKQDAKQELPIPNYANGNGSNSSDSRPMSNVNPINALAHWLCDLSITKVRIDIQFLEETLQDFGLSTNDIRNLKISMYVSGSVTSYQCKPEANWNPLDSKLTWSFNSLTELVGISTINGVTSCLARFDLSDGPTIPSDVSLQFSIAGKTISGSHVILNGTKNFRLAAQKYEVRTGTFKCEPPSL